MTAGPQEEQLMALAEIWRPEERALAEIFSQIPASIGVPGVYLLWRLLANFPSFLTSVWSGLRASLASRELEEAAREVRQSAFLQGAVGPPSHQAFRGDLVRAEIDAEFRGKIINFLELSQYSLSRTLVAAVHLRESLRGAADGKPASTNAAPPRGLVSGAVYVPPLAPGEARGKAVEVLDRVHAEHGLPLLDDFYRSLGRLPDYLSAAWNAIHPLLSEPEYREQGVIIARIAGQSAVTLSQIPAAAETLQRLDATQRQTVNAVLAYFADVHLPQLLVDVTLIKALTAGPDRATRVEFADGEQTIG